MGAGDWTKDWEMCQQLPPEPWTVEWEKGEILIRDKDGVIILCGEGYGDYPTEEDKAIFAFVAVAREALPYWLRKARIWEKVAKRLHKQLLYESRKFGFTVPADLEELAKEIERYLAEVSIEQFEEDLRRAGIEKCPDVEED